MSRFLQHLVERAQGVGERLERRRPALFESRRTPSRAVDELAADDETWTMPAAAEARIPHVTESAPRPQPSALAPAMLPPVPPQSLSTHSSLRSSMLMQVRSPGSRPQAAEVEPGPTRELRQRPPPLQAPLSLSTSRSSPGHSPAPAHNTTRPFPVDDRRTVGLGALSSNEPSSSPTGLARPPRLPANTATTTAVAHPARRTIGNPPPAAAPPPPVHVSIGRIEIRAAATSTPARSAAPSPSPALTLDDYLRRRHGERR